MDIYVVAVGGRGGRLTGPTGTAGSGGATEVTATGSSTTGDVSVYIEQLGGAGAAGAGGATAGSGADSVLEDAASGSTAGTLFLEQRAEGGRGGESDDQARFGSAGSGISRLHTSNAGGGDIVARAIATGGDGARKDPNSSAPTGGAGGVAEAEVVASGSGDVTILASAHGGRGGTGVNSPNEEWGSGGAARLGRVYGSSDGGGEVSVVGELAHGAGGGGGPDAILVNAVDGDTTGRLSLEQIAHAGPQFELRTGGDLQGDAGNSTSALDVSKSVEHLMVRTEAIAGVTGSGAPGVAESTARAFNDAGSVQVLAEATGGERFGSEGTESAGAAFVESHARTTGDDHTIWIGAPPDQDPSLHGAFGGAATGEAGSAGDATSSSQGIAEGDSEVVVWDLAFGGRFRRDESSGAELVTGGDASSTAIGINAGSSPVSVHAEATGGGHPNPGFLVSPGSEGGAHGGNASAVAHGESSSGAVTVEAVTRGGSGERGVPANGGGGDGADVVAIDSVSGRTTGSLTLVQRAQGGEGGWGIARTHLSESADGGDGGAARSELIPDNDRGGALVATVGAVGGNGGRGFGEGRAGRGGDAAGSVVIRDSPASAIDLILEIRGGAGGEVRDGRSGSAGDGGMAAVGEVFASSALGAPISIDLLVSPGQGGDATGDAPAGSGWDAVLDNAIDGETTGSLSLRQVARASRSGLAEAGARGRAGRASSHLSKSGSFDSLTLEAIAQGGSFGGPGSSATAEAVVDALNDAGAVVAVGEATGGVFGTASSAVTARSTAPGAPVTATGRGIGGSSGAGDSSLSRGMDATSETTAISEAGGDVTVTDVAYAGGGTSDGRPGGNASSRALGQTTGTGTVEVSASARAGSGLSGGSSGATGTVSVEARGESELGDVSVTAAADFNRPGFGDSGPGPAPVAILEDVVTGRTGGHLTLRQIADAFSAAPRDGSDRGRAESILHGTNPGGGAITAIAEVRTASREVDTRALVESSSSTAAATAVGVAWGGPLAEVFATARTVGDDHPVTVGLAEGPGEPTPGAWPRVGAWGGSSNFGEAPGDARSRSEGVAGGHSAVSVYDYAVGGSGQRNDGGSGESVALATGNGAPVLASATAAGGWAGSTLFSREFSYGFSRPPLDPVPLGGTARARSDASGTGQVDARAVATGGIGSDRDPLVFPELDDTPAVVAFAVGEGGDAISSATAQGATGSAVARSITQGGQAGWIEASASAWFHDGEATGAAAVGVAGGPLADLPAGAAAISAARLRPAPSEPGASTLTIASGTLGAGFGGGGNEGVQRTEARASVEFHAAVTSGRSDLLLEFNDPIVGPDGFDELVIRVLDDVGTIMQMRFDDEEQANLFLRGSTIDVGNVFPPELMETPPFGFERLVPELFALTVIVEVLGIHSQATGLTTEFRLIQAAAVPEPRAWALFAIAIAVLVLRPR